MAWIQNGPVSVPPTPVVGFIAFVIGATALGAVGLGVRASWRDVSRPAAGEIDTQVSSQAIAAQPIVELPQPQQQAVAATTNAAAASTNSARAAADNSDDIAAKTAAAQAVQSKPSQASGNIDDILTSSSEKPQAPAKPSTDEVPPSGPPKSDVPF